MGAVDNRAAALAALLGILHSPVVRDPVLRACCTHTAQELGQSSPPQGKTGKRRLLGDMQSW